VSNLHELQSRLLLPIQRMLKDLLIFNISEIALHPSNLNKLESNSNLSNVGLYLSPSDIILTPGSLIEA